MGGKGGGRGGEGGKREGRQDRHHVVWKEGLAGLAACRGTVAGWRWARGTPAVAGIVVAQPGLVVTAGDDVGLAATAGAVALVEPDWGGQHPWLERQWESREIDLANPQVRVQSKAAVAVLGRGTAAVAAAVAGAILLRCY